MGQTANVEQEAHVKSLFSKHSPVPEESIFMNPKERKQAKRKS